jgi:hypothetical protein
MGLGPRWVAFGGLRGLVSVFRDASLANFQKLEFRGIFDSGFARICQISRILQG